VTRDVYHQLRRDAAQIDLERSGPIQWLMVITRSRAPDCCRKRRLEKGRSNGVAAFDATDTTLYTDNVLQQFDTGSLLSLTLPSLNAVQARLISVAFFDGLSQWDADFTHMPLGSVKSHLCRAMLELRKALTTAMQMPGMRAKNL
jgi:RNA polymerase sigma-70 factor, ECF subfamily